MSGLMTSMYTGVTALKASQTSVNTTAHNIANVDTKAYTRQQILMGDRNYNIIGGNTTSSFQVGLGTDIKAVRQVRDNFLDQSYRLELGREGFYEAEQGTVNEIETIFGELTQESFSETINSFWTAISEIAKEPDSIVKKGILASTASSFLVQANVIYDQLSAYQENLNGNILDQVNAINNIGDQIRTLNQTIRFYESNGQNANDYRDARNQLLDELGEYAKISFKEDQYGVVTVSIEGVVFCDDNILNKLSTEKSTTAYAQEKADKVNETARKVQEMLLNGDDVEDIKKTLEWRELQEYGSVNFKEDDNGNPVVFLNGNEYFAADRMVDVEPAQSNLLNVIWENSGTDVFKIDGRYLAEANTDVGSLKGLMVSRGSYTANYTDIPVEKDFYNEDGEFEEDKYNTALLAYRANVKESILSSTMAEFDQLIHGIVTSINDIFSPNTDFNEDSVASLFGIAGETVDDHVLATAKITLPDGTELSYNDKIIILDEANAPVGTDENHTFGEALFNRKSVDRYTEATMTAIDADGNEIEKTVYVYNQEYASNNYSLFTLGEIVVNDTILNDTSKLELCYNDYNGYAGAYNLELCQNLMNVWDNASLKLGPDTLTYNTFVDYYSALTIDVADRGSVYTSIAENQSSMVESIDNKRQSIMGVSSDEELTNLIRFQQAYNASSRYITAISEMLEHIILRLGA
ncbi:MAG: flagellar hook-associated protein FlgK [Lachnospiraceae bacterium]|nr:flagellar hook-associated protein FlgK [Lachnospiraceae bacterium]